MNIFDRIFGNCSKGIHKFESFLIKEVPPQGLKSFKGNSYQFEDLVDSMTKREYEIRCKHCGKKLED